MVKSRWFCIRPQYKSGLIDRCKPLGEYTWFVEKVRDNRKKMGIAAAVDNAIMAMPEDFIIRSFLEQHQSEVRNMCLTEYKEAETTREYTYDPLKRKPQRQTISSDYSPEDFAL